MIRFVPFLLLLAAAPASAQTPAERALALAIAKVGVNEASLIRVTPADVALVHQTAATHGDTPHARLAWLRAHSNCVLSDREMSETEAAGNCPWSRGLRDDDTRPEAWPSTLSWPRFRERWRQVRTLALALVLGTRSIEPCPEPPWTWGGPMDRARALERGMRPLGCRDPETGLPLRNEGYALR